MADEQDETPVIEFPKMIQSQDGAERVVVNSADEEAKMREQLAQSEAARREKANNAKL